MNVVKPLLLSFSLLAFAGAVAAASDDAKKDSSASQTKPAMSQSDNKASSQAQQASSTSKSDSASAGASKDRSAAMQADGGMSAKKLMGMDVVDAQGKDLGEIKEVVLDLHNARVHAAVLEFGGVLGLGSKQYAFPVSELKPAKDKDKLALNVDKEKLKDQQGFEKDKWPAMDDKYWGEVGTRDKAGAGGTQAQTQASDQKVNLHRASKLMGQDVHDKSGKEVGEIQDVLLSADRMKIQHIVLDVKGAGHARIEPKDLSLGTGDKLMVNMSADQLKGQAGKDKQAQSGTKSDTQSSASTGASGSAAAGASAGQRSFSELDKDNDGTLSQMEAAGDANAKSNFEKLDKNNDKKLTREEWQAGQGGAAAGGTGASGATGASGSGSAAATPGASGTSGAKSGAAGTTGSKPDTTQPKSK